MKAEERRRIRSGKRPVGDRNKGKAQIILRPVRATGATVIIEEEIPAVRLGDLAHRENNYNSCRTEFSLRKA
jgi:hypothetical protein